MYAEPFGLDKARFKKAMMNAGSKNTTLPQGEVRTISGQEKAATTNTGTGVNSSGKTVGGILGIQ
jgi:hypothetical protein